MPRMRSIVLFIIIGTVVTIGFSRFLSSLDPGSIKNSSSINSRHQIPVNGWSDTGDRIKNIFWIVQISDIHISKYRDLARSPDLEKFCQDYLPIINPEVVLITGDLTDGKTESGIESMQIRDEWVMYENAIRKCRLFTRASWLDLRGNHDAFDVFDFKSKNNYYRLHSVHGGNMKKISNYNIGYVHNVELPFGLYTFVGFDACSRPGPNRPFNFFGYLDDKQIDHLNTLATVVGGSNHTVWFGHFPTSLIVHNPPVLRQIMNSSIAYLCGHLHTLSNYVPRMYSRHKSGQLELELGDWKDNRIFRVMAFDHDLMSFTDSKLGKWPVILITNPKNNQFYSPREPLEMLILSTHIRILVFSQRKIKQVKVEIDKHLEGFAHQVAPNQPLYVLSWVPLHYSNDRHVITVTVMDEYGINTTVSHQFSMDGTETRFDILPRLILMLNIYSVGKLVFGLIVLIYTIILTSLRYCSNVRLCYLKGRNCFVSFVNMWIMKLWLVSHTDVSYYMMIGSVIHLSFGPWFVGYLLSDRIGVVFVWGILFQSSFIPGGITYFYGIFHFITFTAPLTLILGQLLDTRRKHGPSTPLCDHLFVLALTTLLFTFTVYVVLTEFPRAYGQTSLLLGPLRTGSTLMLPLSIWFTYRTDLKQVLAASGFSCC